MDLEGQQAQTSSKISFRALEKNTSSRTFKIKAANRASRWWRKKKNIEAYSKTSITEEEVQDVEDQQSDSSEESEDQYQEEVEEEEPSR